MFLVRVPTVRMLRAVSCGAGAVDVLKQDSIMLKRIAHVEHRRERARRSSYRSLIGLYVAAPAFEGAGASIKIYRPAQ